MSLVAEALLCLGQVVHNDLRNWWLFVVQLPASRTQGKPATVAGNSHGANPATAANAHLNLQPRFRLPRLPHAEFLSSSHNKVLAVRGEGQAGSELANP